MASKMNLLYLKILMGMRYVLKFKLYVYAVQKTTGIHY